MTRKISKNVWIKKTQILPTRMNLMSTVLSIIQMPLAIEILISTQTRLPLLANILLSSLTFITILGGSIRRKRLLQTLRNYA